MGPPSAGAGGESIPVSPPASGRCLHSPLTGASLVCTSGSPLGALPCSSGTCGVGCPVRTACWPRHRFSWDVLSFSLTPEPLLISLGTHFFVHSVLGPAFFPFYTSLNFPDVFCDGLPIASPRSGEGLCTIQPLRRCAALVVRPHPVVLPQRRVPCTAGHVCLLTAERGVCARLCRLPV